MYFGYILGFVFLPVSILLFANSFGFIKMDGLFGFSLTLLGAIGIILVEVGDIIDSHIHGNAILVYFTAGALCIPGILYFLSLVAKLPSGITAALPLMIASFLFVEGVSSFRIGD